MCAIVIGAAFTLFQSVRVAGVIVFAFGISGTIGSGVVFPYQFGKTVGTLVKQDLLNHDLVYDLWWVEGVWSRVGPLRHANERSSAKHGSTRTSKRLAQALPNNLGTRRC